MKKLFSFLFLFVFGLSCVPQYASAHDWINSSSAGLSVYGPIDMVNDYMNYSECGTFCSGAGGRIPSHMDFGRVWEEKAGEFSSAGFDSGAWWTTQSQTVNYHWTQHMLNFPNYASQYLDSSDQYCFCVKDYTPPPAPPVYDSPAFGSGSNDVIYNLFGESAELYIASLWTFLPLLEFFLTCALFFVFVRYTFRTLKSLVSKF